MSNCAPRLLCQLVEKTLGESPPLLKRYAEDRESVFKEIQEDRPDLDKPTLKKAFLAIVNGGRGLEEKNPPQIVKSWKVMWKDLSKKLWEHETFQKHRKAIVEEKGKKNPLGTFMSRLWQEKENTVLLAMMNHIEKKEGLRVGVLVFDGLMVERDEKRKKAPLDEGVLRRTEQAVFEKTGYYIKLAEKSLEPTKEDLEILAGEKISVEQFEKEEKEEEEEMKSCCDVETVEIKTEVIIESL